MKNYINIKLIEEYLKLNFISKTRFCKLCKISPKTYKKIMSGSTDFDIFALLKIAREINVELYEMFVR